MLFGKELLEQALQTLGEVLDERGLHFEVVAIGGSSLMLLGFISRSTRDLDLLAEVEDGNLVKLESLPPSLAEARDDVSRAIGLPGDWLNVQPSSLMDFGLPEGFDERLETRTFGGLTLRLAGRFDQVCFKLYALVDQGPQSKHEPDLRSLEPTQEELMRAAQWTRTQDPSEGFRLELDVTLRRLGVNVDEKGS